MGKHERDFEQSDKWMFDKTWDGPTSMDNVEIKAKKVTCECGCDDLKTCLASGAKTYYKCIKCGLYYFMDNYSWTTT